MSVLKILSLGNSFSQDAQGNLHNILDSVGIENKCVNLVVGGCSLEMHCNFLKTNEDSYYYEINGVYEKMTNIREGFTAEKYDAVTMQQASHFSGQYETYEPFLTNLIEFKKETQPDAKLFFHSTWAYEFDSDHWAFPMYDKSTDKMSEAIKECGKKVEENHGITVINNTGLVEKLRSEKYFNREKGGLNITRDGFHLDLVYGRYAAGLMFAKKIAGADPLKVTFAPEGADPEIAEYIRKTVAEID